MNVVDIVRVLWDDSVGNPGAVRNCREELVRRRDDEREVDRLHGRIERYAPTHSTDEARSSA